ncbi:MAG: hypothetical protein ABIE47_05910 [Pseudomonadota bacterium]
MKTQRQIYGDAATGIKVTKIILSDESIVYDVQVPAIVYHAKDERDAAKVYQILIALLVE